MYSESYFLVRESWRDWRIEAQQLIRLARVLQGMCVLEIGCGGGGLMRMLSARGACAVGVDTLESALKVARHKWQVTSNIGSETINVPHPLSPITRHLPLLQIGDDAALPFCDHAFDAIIGQHVIEHITDTDAALREWARVLKPGGRLALATPNARYPDPAHFADADHAHIFSPRELRNATERAGFVVECCFTIFPFLTRARLLRALGVIAHDVFRRVPYFAARGRTIMLGARKI